MLEGPSLLPSSGGNPKQLVVFLHGYGANGDDLISLGLHWRHHFPDTYFISPNAPQPCDTSLSGRQWFSLRDSWSTESLLADVAESSFPLNTFIDKKLADLNLRDDNLALVGFSQGVCVALHTAFYREQTCAGIIGYSGNFVLDKKSPIVSKPKVLLVHGDKDDIVPLEAMTAAERTLKKLEINVTTKITKGLGHVIDLNGRKLGRLFLNDIFLKGMRPKYQNN
jgi:phospholipase/carboxylesterase